LQKIELNIFERTNMLHTGTKFLLFVFVIIWCSSCGVNKKFTEELRYFKGLNDSLKISMPINEPKIEKNDVLFIGISSSDPQKTDLLLNPYVMQGIGQTSSNNTTNTLGYMVDNEGDVTLPLIGKVPAFGKTKEQLTNAILQKLRVQVQDPIVNVRFLNFRITVIGEVTRPGSYSIPNEKVNLLESLGMAGDLTPFARRDNILIIREKDGKQEFARMNLSGNTVFQSPYFQLKQNDIVYVDINNRKVPNADQASTRNISLIIGITSSLGILLTAINALTK
jgi:polysaccharide export outer membrane protein